MSGQGNPAPRPGASFQQLPLGLGAPQPLQQGGQGPGRPVMQHLGNQSGSPFYQTTLMPPHPHVQQVPQSEMPNIGLYVHGPHPHLGNNQIPYHYPPGQQNSQHPPQLGVQNLYRGLPPRSNLPPPPPLPLPPGPASHGFQHTGTFMPPSANIYRGVAQPAPPSSHQGFPHFQPPPPLASALHIIAHSESYSLSTPNDSHLVVLNPPPPPSLLSSSTPAPPAPPPSCQPISDANELTPADVISASESHLVMPNSNRFTVQNQMSDGHADNEPTSTSQKDDSSEIVDRIYHEGEACVSMTDDLSANDIKSELVRPEARYSSHLDNLTSGAGLCSTVDSDMDLEDDIMYLVEDLETNASSKDHNVENLTQDEELGAKEQLLGQIPSPTSSSGMPGEGALCSEFIGQASGRESPIKLLQGYAFDDATEDPYSANVNCSSHILPAVDQSAILKKVGEPNFSRDGGSEKNSPTDGESIPVFSEHSVMQNKATEETEMNLKKSFTTSVALGKVAKQSRRDGSKESLCDESQHSSQVNDRSKPGDITSMRVKSRKEDTTGSVQLKYDEFGRLAKDVSSDSDSDDLRYSRKWNRRGRSRSISPFDRRRRTPLGRRNNWSRSRSRSPLKRRSRSRSPGYRRPNECIAERRRRDKSQTSVCFSFRDGRCRRGSSCRFLHHDSDRSGSSNYYKSKQRASEDAHGDNGSNFLERSKRSLGEMGSQGDDKTKSHGSQQMNSLEGIHSNAARDNNVTDKNEVGHGITIVEHTQTNQDGRGEAAQVEEASMPLVTQDHDASNRPSNDRYQKSAQTCHPYDSSSLQSLANSSAVFSSNEPSGANHSAAVLQYADLQPQKLNVSYGSIPAHHPSLGTSHQLTTSEPQLDSILSSSQSYATVSLRPVLSENSSLQLPSSGNVTPFLQVSNDHYMPHLQRNLSLMRPSMGLPPPHTPGGVPSYNRFSVPNQPHQSHIQTNPLWTSLPPPLPQAIIYANIPKENTSTSGNTIPFHFDQNQQPQRTGVPFQNISGPYHGQVHCNSQYGTGRNEHVNYQPSHEAHRPPLAFPVQRSDALIGNSHSQQIEGLGRIPSTFHVQPNTSLFSPPAIKTLPSSETAYEVSSQNDNISKDTSLEHSRNYVTGDSRFKGVPGKIESNSLRTSSANLDVPGIAKFELTGTLAHCNPYASTFDRPLVAKLNQSQMRGQGVEEHKFRETSPSTSFVKNAGQIFPESVGGQYDPLLDSIEKSSNSLVNSERVKKQRSTSDSDNMQRRSASRKPLDVEETNRKKESEAIASLTSSENDEFGETADAEVGVVENGSFSNQVDMPNRSSEAAISETLPDKKSKDSRSMKLFKSAIANFVKEVLKPSWRQGNMSKEAFKTIVKKTVEKVSGAMKGHRYPKSQAKINHYIDSSERKLTKLVMGYVDKYVNV
ncbi:unnamed protein product [Rhodiola kirilowii]